MKRASRKDLSAFSCKYPILTRLYVFSLITLGFIYIPVINLVWNGLGDGTLKTKQDLTFMCSNYSKLFAIVFLPWRD